MNIKTKLDYTEKEETANTLTHALGIALSLLGLFSLILQSIQNKSIEEFISYLIFGVSLIALYSASTAYHFVKPLKQKLQMKKLDHICIYYLIAGSYTPFIILNLEGMTSVASFIIIWSIAIAGTVIKLKEKKRNLILSVSLYLIMGWLILFIKGPMLNSMPEQSKNLLFIGGLFYTLGVPFYMLKKVPYHHAIWHLMVLGGSICHFFSIKWTNL